MELHVRREMVLPLEREEAWPLISDPDELETWFAERVELQLHPGAEGEVAVEGERRRAVVEEIVPARRVVLRWWAQDEEASVVELTLDDDPAGTRLTILEVPARTLHAVGVALDRGVPAAPGPTMALVGA
jgi:uncharacterized protein YndB with AHSA1/START domain